MGYSRSIQPHKLLLWPLPSMEGRLIGQLVCLSLLTARGNRLTTNISAAIKMICYRLMTGFPPAAAETFLAMGGLGFCTERPLWES
ncbi:hypothetical protein SUGI_0781950 [Cryptomeria japonica]|nr:hypothetical protein SUGI_0781950 [Cryptomeria japonica]